jgi:hypothetical protein
MGFALVKTTISDIYHRNLLIAMTNKNITEDYRRISLPPKTNVRSVSYEGDSGFEIVISGVLPGISFNDSYLHAL